MKVKAKQLGFYNHRRQKEGQVFHIKAVSEFSEVWMEAIGWDPKAEEKVEVAPLKKVTKKASKVKAVEPKVEIDSNSEVI